MSIDQGPNDECTALAAYGSLAPGEENHWVVSRLAGEWKTATVRGWVFEIGWGPAEGWLGFVRDAAGTEITLDLLVSDKLPSTWREIDDFEGPGYERRTIEVIPAEGPPLLAQIYEVVPDA